MDAVGRERGLIEGSGGQERDATLNQVGLCLLLFFEFDLMMLRLADLYVG